MQYKVFLFSVASLLLNIVCVSAKPISYYQALNLASKYIDVVSYENPNVSVCRRLPAYKAQNPAFYVFNAKEDKGFVIVSGDDELPEMLGYSDKGHFNVDNMHPELEALLNNFSSLVSSVRNGEKIDFDLSVSTADYKVGPLCDTEWGQDAPYYALCPEIDGVRCPVGCVATAMAQIMYYHKWPLEGKGKLSYATGIKGVGVLSSDFSTHKYEWDKMLLTTNDNKISSEAAAEVSKLCYDCGISVRMTYSADKGSGATEDSALRAFYNYFGYRASTIQMKYRDCFASQSEWNNIIRNEIDAKRPVMYSGNGKEGGHEFVIDGYDSNGYFHVNWGWDGTSNGFYPITTLVPSGSAFGFPASQSMVYGIEPNRTEESETPLQTRMYMMKSPTTDVVRVKNGDQFQLSLHELYNYVSVTHTYYISAGLFNAKGKMLRIIGMMPSQNKVVFPSYQGFSQYDINCRITLSLADGYYTIRALFKDEDYSEWLEPDTYGGPEKNQIPVSVKNGIMYLNDASVGIQEILSDNNSSSQSNERAISTSFYDLYGRMLSNPSSNSFVIMRSVYKDGSVASKKLYIE